MADDPVELFKYKVIAVETKIENLKEAVEKLEVNVTRQFDKLAEQVTQAAQRDRAELTVQIDKTTQSFVSMLEKSIEDQNAKYRELLPLKYKVTMILGGLFFAGILFNLFGKGLFERLLTLPKP